MGRIVVERGRGTDAGRGKGERKEAVELTTLRAVFHIFSVESRATVTMLVLAKRE